MRLTRLTGADVRRDPASLPDAVKAIGFFAGPRVVLVEEAGDGNAAAFRDLLADWKAGDASIVVTAGALSPRSALRKAFEAARNAFAIGIYADAMRREDITAALEKAGIEKIAPDVMGDVEALASALNPGDFAQFVDKLALYKRGDGAPLSSGDILACAPPAPEADLDALVDLAADGRADNIARAFASLGARSGIATSLTIAASRHFRALHAASLDVSGPESALAKARPPVFGPRRARMAAQARAFGTERLELAMAQIMETDLRLRSGRPTPGLALVERLFVRLARMSQR